jgi:hypothetical protein
MANRHAADWQLTQAHFRLESLLRGQSPFLITKLILIDLKQTEKMATNRTQ